MTADWRASRPGSPRSRGTTAAGCPRRLSGSAIKPSSHLRSRPGRSAIGRSTDPISRPSVGGSASPPRGRGLKQREACQHGRAQKSIIRKRRPDTQLFDQNLMRHMAHSCVTSWSKTALESGQCDTVLAKSDTESRRSRKNQTAQRLKCSMTGHEVAHGCALRRLAEIRFDG